MLGMRLAYRRLFLSMDCFLDVNFSMLKSMKHQLIHFGTFGIFSLLGIFVFVPVLPLYNQLLARC